MPKVTWNNREFHWDWTDDPLEGENMAATSVTGRGNVPKPKPVVEIAKSNKIDPELREFLNSNPNAIVTVFVHLYERPSAIQCSHLLNAGVLTKHTVGCIFGGKTSRLGVETMAEYGWVKLIKLANS
jgi:hypothetical protein